MKKLLPIVIPMALLLIFILVMFSDNFLKNPLSKNDDMPKSIEVLKSDLNNNNWDQAAKNINQLSSVWKKVAQRVQFAAGKSSINSIFENISRLRGAIIAKDKSNALIELNDAYEKWKNIGH